MGNCFFGLSCETLIVFLQLGGAPFGFRRQDTAPPPNFQVPADKLAAFVGQYVFVDDPDLVRSISLEGSRVFIESFRTRKVELLPQSEDTFTAFNATVKFKFLRSTEGKVMGFNRMVEEGTGGSRTPA